MHRFQSVDLSLVHILREISTNPYSNRKRLDEWRPWRMSSLSFIKEWLARGLDADVSLTGFLNADIS